MVAANIPIPHDRIADFCRRWKITEFALFGSVLRDDFGPNSDVDVLVTFAPDAHWTLFNLVRMSDELAALFNRPVDLLTRLGVEQGSNPFRKREILSSAQVVYAA